MHFTGTKSSPWILLLWKYKKCSACIPNRFNKAKQTDKASGPGGLSNRILKELSHELSSILRSPFNKSLSLGNFPSSYKDANVTHVHKKGDLSLVSNYRPISLLNSVTKLFEKKNNKKKLVFKYLYNHLQDNNMLSYLQSGFIPGDSTVNQLAYLYHYFTEALDAGKEVRTVFLIKILDPISAYLLMTLVSSS